MENAIGMMILGMIIVALLVLFLYAQASLISTSLEMRERIRLERARAEENIRISWLSDQEILLTNDGARDTVVRYLYIYPEGSEVPTKYVRLNLTLRVGESKRINLAALGLIPDPMSIIDSLPHGPGGGNVKYYLCYDGYNGSHYEKECFVEHSFEFPSKDRLDYGIEGYSLYHTRHTDSKLAIISDLNEEGKYWTACAWIKINLTSSNEDFSLIRFHEEVNFNYDKSLGVIYAEVSHGGELGRDPSNPSDPSEWNLYCVTIDYDDGSNETVIKFYVNGVLIDSTSTSPSVNFKLFKVRLPANPPFGYWVDDIFLTNRTLSRGEIRMLFNLDKPDVWRIEFSFDYTLRKPRKVESVTDLGNVFSSVRPEKAILGIPVGGG